MRRCPSQLAPSRAFLALPRLARSCSQVKPLPLTHFQHFEPCSIAVPIAFRSLYSSGNIKLYIRISQGFRVALVLNRRTKTFLGSQSTPTYDAAVVINCRRTSCLNL